MRRVSIVHDFKHGGGQFYQGELRFVTDADADYFIKCGWATENGNTPLPLNTDPVRLEVQSTKHVSSSRVI